MSTFDFTPIQKLLGHEICFHDLAFEDSFREHKSAFKDTEFRDQFFREERFKFGFVKGCTIYLDDTGNTFYSIFVGDSYYNLSELELLFVSI